MKLFYSSIHNLSKLHAGKFVIYMMTCKSTGLAYVGCTSDLYMRVLSHYSHAKTFFKNNLIAKAIREYGIEDFDVVVLDSDSDELHAREVLEPSYISLHNTFKNGLNETAGKPGKTGYRMSEQTKKQIRLTKIQNGYTTHNSRWFNDGTEETRVLKHKHSPNGWVRGRLPYKKHPRLFA
jgi:group I intron endonuclease